MEQKELFGPQDTIPKVSTILKKVISKERLIEASNIYKSGDNKTSAQILSDLNDGLERIERRIFNKKD